MKRNTLIEQLTEVVRTLDEGQLEQLLAFANVLTAAEDQKEEIREEMDRRGRELAELAEAARDLRRATLSRSESEVCGAGISPGCIVRAGRRRPGRSCSTDRRRLLSGIHKRIF